MMNGEPDEYELVLRAREGDRDALAELVERTRLKLFALAYAELRHYDDAHDAVAAALLRICRHVAEVREPARVGAWMQRIVRNEVRRLRRGPDAATPLEEEQAPAGDGEPSLLRLDIERALRKLPGDQARAIRLYYLADLSVPDIAERLGRSENTVKSWLYRGRRHLASHMEGYAPMTPRPKAVLVHTDLETALAQQVTDALRAAGYDPRVLNPVHLDGVLYTIKGAHCIVLDEWIGGRSAFELVIHMKANPATREIPICLLCAEPSNFTVSTCWAAGVDRLLNTKSPEDMAQLAEAFRATHGRGTPVTAREEVGATAEAGISRRTLLKAAGAAAVGAAAIGAAASPEGAAAAEPAAPDGAIDPAALQDLPLLPVRDKVYFPNGVFPIFIGRAKTVRAMEEALSAGGVVFLVAQKQMQVDDPGPEELYEVGTVARLFECLQMPDGTRRVMVCTQARARITAYLQTDPCVRVRAELLPVEEDRSPDATALIAHVSSQLKQHADQGETAFAGALTAIAGIDEAGQAADCVTLFLPVAIAAQQAILETVSPRDRLLRVSAMVLAFVPRGSWERFTERARRVVFFAQEEATRLGGNDVGTEHLLLGLLREQDSLAGRILDRLQLPREQIRSEIERRVMRGASNPGQEMLLTPRAKRMIDLAFEEARQLKNDYIGTEHLLLGLLREGEGQAARLLIQMGADLKRVRAAVAEAQKAA
jgi:RNA polymerase sigma factor (sigma-70 family)